MYIFQRTIPGTLLFYSQMKMRPGEKLIDKMDAVEDTKGNNGERGKKIDWLQSLKQFFINVPYHILVASLTLMALF